MLGKLPSHDRREETDSGPCWRVGVRLLQQVERESASLAERFDISARLERLAPPHDQYHLAGWL